MLNLILLITNYQWRSPLLNLWVDEWHGRLVWAGAGARILFIRKLVIISWTWDVSLRKRWRVNRSYCGVSLLSLVVHSLLWLCFYEARFQLTCLLLWRLVHLSFLSSSYFIAMSFYTFTSFTRRQTYKSKTIWKNVSPCSLFFHLKKIRICLLFGKWCLFYANLINN